MFKADRLPFDPGPAAWNNLLPPAPLYPEQEGNITADVTIIGAGFAGISAARRLRQLDPSLSIVLLEARRVAEGPAGRNSGFMIDLPHNLASKDYAGTQDNDRAQTQANRAAISFAGDAANEYNMQQEAFEKSGKINAAATRSGDRHNKDYAEHLNRMGEPCKLMDARQMQAISGSDYYTSGLFTPGTAMIQPALYVRDFVAGLARGGVSAFENSPALHMMRDGKNWAISTPKGTVRTGKIILGVNGHAESFGFFKRRLIHIYLYASMTQALSTRQSKALGGQARWGFTPADPMGSTVRRINGIGGDRLVIRNSISWAPERTIGRDKHDNFAAIHQRSFIRRFPQLQDIQMQYRWGGLLCLSRNAAPAFGEVERGIFAACCQNGLGTAMGTLSGMAAAERVMDKETDQTQFFEAQSAPAKLPPKPIAALGAQLTLKWGQFAAGREL